MRQRHAGTVPELLGQLAATNLRFVVATEPGRGSRLEILEELVLDVRVTLAALEQSREILVRQRKELAEIVLNFETRNKYEILSQDGQLLGFAAEQGKGWLAVLARQFFGHWRTFDLHIFDAARNLIWVATHPFRWLFQRLELRDATGGFVGAIQQRFGLLYKRFDVEAGGGRVVLTMAAPRWRLWTFPFLRHGREVACVHKKWSGVLKEAFTDADNFRIAFSSVELSPTERALILAAALFIDLLYFETKDR
jgi:uncharacterized protein YxjI